MTAGARLLRPRTLGAAAAALAAVAAFVQVERGVGNAWRSLLYAGHDLMVAAAIGLVVLLVTRRPWVSAFVGVAVTLLIWFASHLKVAATDTPALASDLPRIFDTWDVVVGFGWPVLAAVGACAAIAILVTRIEYPIRIGWRHRLSAIGALTLLTAGAGAMQARIPVDDDDVVTNNGPKIAQFLRSVYVSPDFRDASFPVLGPYCCFRNADRPSLAFAGETMPHIVVVLQESTFPPENLRGVAAVRNRLLDGSSPLLVDVVGGGTWVEEYALLHGVPPSVYGRDFLQILWLGRMMGLEGRLAPMLADAGYSTVSIMPYFGHELGDSAAMQRSLGFHRVVTCAQLAGCGRGGAWTEVSDASLYARALQELRAADGPAFVYVATMRQHSPHVAGYPKRAYRDEIVAEYLRRLEMSATEANDFLAATRSLSRPTIVLMFGDHIATDVNLAFAPEEFARSRRRTYFNLYDPEGRAIAATLMAEHPSVEAPSTAFLDAILLRFAGFTSDYIDRKLAMMRGCGGVFCGKPGGGSEVVARGAPQ